MKKTISVIIPIYNMQTYLKECLDSVVNQTLSDIEIIAINDGSTDGSAQILDEYRKKYDNIIVYNQRNQGQASAKNYGIRQAHGKYIIIMDPDDYYPNNTCLEAIYNCAEIHKVPICGGVMLDDNNSQITETDQEITSEFYQNKYVFTREYNDVYHHQRFLFEREFLINNNIFFPLYKRYEDPPFTIKALCISGGFFASDIRIYVHRVGYKREKATLRVCIDILSGIRDTIKLCIQNELPNIYDQVYKNMVEAFFLYFHKYSYMGIEELDRIVDEINADLLMWKGKSYHVITPDEVIRIRNKSLEHYFYIKFLLQSKANIIVYGAGKRTKELFHMFNENIESIVGIAVSSGAEIGSVNGIKIQCINNYNTEELRENAYILVTPAEPHLNSIKKTLLQLRFENVIPIEMQLLRLADSILNE